MKDLTKTLLSGLALMVAVCSQAWAADEIDCPSGSPSGASCWKCGNTAADCTATYSDGKLSISGNGAMKNYDYNWRHTENSTFITNAPWAGIADNITQVEVKGVSSIGNSSFIGLRNMQSIDIDNSVLTIGSTSIDDCASLTNIYIPSSVKNIGSWALFNNPNLQNIVMSSSTRYDSNLYSHVGQLLKYASKGELIYVYDNEGNVRGVYNDFSILKNNAMKGTQNNFKIHENGDVIVYDSMGNILGKYNNNGNLLQKYTYNPDGSVGIYDVSGKLTGLKNARKITPAQAAELTKPGKNNTVTLTFK